MTQDSDHTDDIALAGEYALHLLDAPSRAAFEARLEVEPELRVLVREWDEGLVPWSDEIADVVPPARVKAAIDARLFDTEKTGFSWAGLFGRRFAVLAVACFALLAFFVGSKVFNDDGPLYVAQIAGEDRSLVVAAAFDPDTAQLVLTRTTGAAAAGRSLEVWLIADGADVPVSLGVLTASQEVALSVPDDLAPLMAGGTLAITDEPFGGSPTGMATGPVVAIGKINLS